MALTKEDLLRTLNSLTNKDFKEFRWFLQQEQKNDERSFPTIARCRLETADRTDTVDLMMETYVIDTCAVTAIILEKMGKSNLIKRLNQLTGKEPVCSEQTLIKSKTGNTTKLSFLQPSVTHSSNKRNDMMRDFSRYLKNGQKLGDGPPARYQLKPDRVNLDGKSHKKSKLRRFTLGKRDDAHQNRTILLIGARGTGKSTLVNALVNFVMGVRFEDKVWFEMVVEDPQSNSQTTAVSVYEIFGFEGTTVPFSLTIIDTPGYGETKGMEHDEIVTQKIQDVFLVPDEVETIDAVGLVMKSTENRLDQRMAYTFNSVTSLFGRNVEKNIVVMITHSDGRKPKHALRALEDARVKCARNKNRDLIHFLFNNCQKEKIENGRSAERVARNAFETSVEGLEDFTTFLGEVQPQGMETCVENIKQRVRLSACIQNLKERVTDLEAKQAAIKMNREELLKHQQEGISSVEKNTSFTMVATDTYKARQDIMCDAKAVSCLQCKETCQYPACSWALSSCEVMEEGLCTVCSGRCPLDKHVKDKWTYVTKTRTVRKSSADMKSRHEQNTENRAESERSSSLMEDLEKDMSNLQQTKSQCLHEALNVMEELEKSLDVVSTQVHLQFLMEKMEENGDTGKLQRLSRMRDRLDARNQAAAVSYRKSVLGTVKEFMGLS